MLQVFAGSILLSVHYHSEQTEKLTHGLELYTKQWITIAPTMIPHHFIQTNR